MLRRKAAVDLSVQNLNKWVQERAVKWWKVTNQWARRVFGLVNVRLQSQFFKALQAGSRCIEERQRRHEMATAPRLKPCELPRLKPYFSTTYAQRFDLFKQEKKKLPCHKKNHPTRF